MIDTMYAWLVRAHAGFGALLDTSPLPNNKKNADAPSDMLANALEIVFGIIGAAAVLIIVISGFRYIVSAGDPGQMSQANKTIIYAVIGLAVALSGFSIVSFVVRNV